MVKAAPGRSHGHVITHTHIGRFLAFSCSCGWRTRGWMKHKTVEMLTINHRREEGLL
jgi:hypothetical protein